MEIKWRMVINSNGREFQPFDKFFSFLNSKLFFFLGGGGGEGGKGRGEDVFPHVNEIK